MTSGLVCDFIVCRKTAPILKVGKLIQKRPENIDTGAGNLVLLSDRMRQSHNARAVIAIDRRLLPVCKNLLPLHLLDLAYKPHGYSSSGLCQEEAGSGKIQAKS